MQFQFSHGVQEAARGPIDRGHSGGDPPVQVGQDVQAGPKTNQLLHKAWNLAFADRLSNSRVPRSAQDRRDTGDLSRTRTSGILGILVF